MVSSSGERAAISCQEGSLVITCDHTLPPYILPSPLK